ncbi:hypothetical protein BDF22DRAFT_774099 [Syncephalis plumigaleata]|nr:hypothetical protein BDF22DRAFT_774099 [Syncephalis plumigaleata]
MANTQHIDAVLEQFEWLKQTEWLSIDAEAVTRLSSLADTHPARFYRPFLVCASASKVHRVTNDLGQLIHLSNILPSHVFFFNNLDLATTVLATEPPHSNGSTLGQHALVLEYTLHIAELKRSNTMSRVERGKTAAFLLQLEHRISVLLFAREASKKIVPISLFILLIGLLSEIRHVVRADPLSRPNWIDLLITRITDYSLETNDDHDATTTTATGSWSNILTKLGKVYDRLSRTGISMEENGDLQQATQPAMMVHRLRSWVIPGLMSSMPSFTRATLLSQWSETIKSRMQRLIQYPRNAYSMYIEAIMASWSLLSDNDRHSVQIAIWRMGPHLYGERARLLFSLAIQTSSTFSDIVRQEIPQEYLCHTPSSIDVTFKRYIPQQLNWLMFMSSAFSERHRIQLNRLAATGVKRPVSATMPPPLPFISTDIDTEKREEFTVGSTLLEAKLGQLGISDTERIAQEKRERLAERLLFQSAVLLDGQERGIRQRVRLLPAQELIYHQLEALCQHPSALIATQAMQLINAYERDEPSLLWRAPQSIIGNAKIQDKSAGLHRIRCHTSLVGQMPPNSVNSTINFIMGMAKYGLREKPELLDPILVEVFPVLTALVPHTGRMSIKALRKNKLEALITTANNFWLPGSNQDGHDALVEINRGQALNGQLKSQLMRTTFIRIAQAQWLTSIIRHNSKECLELSKVMTSFIPDLPHVNKSSASDGRQLLEALVHLRACAWLNFLTAMIDLIDEHRASAENVVSIAAGLDRILRYCYEDTLLLPQVLMAYERISRRFRALLAQTSGDPVILPALFEVYVALHPKPAANQVELAWRTLRDISPDEFLFYALCAVAPIIVDDTYNNDDHDTNGVQDDSRTNSQKDKVNEQDDSNEDTSEQTIKQKTPEQQAWLFFQLLLVLDVRHPDHIALATSTTIASFNQAAASASTTMRRGRTFSNFDSSNTFLTGNTSTNTGNNSNHHNNSNSNSNGNSNNHTSNTSNNRSSNDIMVMNYNTISMAATTPQYNSVLIDVNNSRHVTETLKLLVTIIAYNPTLRIAEQFTKLLRLLLPNCTANDVLSSSIDALSPVMRDFAKHSKYLAGTPSSQTTASPVNEHPSLQSTLASSLETRSILSHLPSSHHHSNNHGDDNDNKRMENDHIIIRQEFIRLLGIYIDHTGQLSWRQAKCACLVIRSTLKDLVSAKVAHKTEWVGQFLDSLAQISDRSLVLRILEFFLRQLAPIFGKLFVSADYSGLIDGLSRLLGVHNYGNIPLLHELILDRYVQPMLLGLDRHLAVRDLVGITGRLIAALLLHRDADVATVLDGVSPQLQCQLLPRLCTALAQLTLDNNNSNNNSNNTGVPSHHRRNSARSTSLIWHYPLQLIETNYMAVLTLQSSKLASDSRHLGPNAKRASLLAVGGMGAVEDATMYTMVSQLALSLRVILLVLGRHPLLMTPSMRHWIGRMVRAFLAFFGNCLTTYVATDISSTRRSGMRPPSPVPSTSSNGMAPHRRMHTVGPMATVALTVWTLSEQLLMDRHLIIPCQLLLRQVLQSTIDVDWWQPPSTTTGTNTNGNDGYSLPLDTANDHRQALLVSTSGGLAERLHDTTNRAMARIYSYLVEGYRPDFGTITTRLNQIQQDLNMLRLANA